tara:strand:- start:328 stop:603 length:276 start_codon:yes stop_codon:yes gene_type:complete
MSRYLSTKRKTDEKTKKQNYGTTIYQEVVEKNDDLYFISQQGDRCDNLANRFYNDPALWWFIARVNNLNTMNIPIGTSLRIPATTKDAKGG